MRVLTIAIYFLFILIVFFGLPVGALPQNPSFDIKVNNSDGPVVIAQPDALKISVALDNDDIMDTADWWFAAVTPYNVLFLTPNGWSSEILPAYQGPLFTFPLIDIFNIAVSGFPVGTYYFFVGVDTHVDGIITWDSLYWNSAEVTLAVDAEKQGDNVSAILGPLFVYYLERYFSESPDESETGKELAIMLDNAPEHHAFFMRMLNKYKGLSDETKVRLFDARIVEMTGSINQDIDLGIIKGRIDELAPQSASLISPDIDLTVPAAPSGLAAQNVSNYDSLQEFPSYAIKLTWHDNSDEDGFVIYRASKGPGDLLYGNLTEIGKVSPNVTEYLDKLAVPKNKGDQYCYQLAAYKVSPIALVGQSPAQIDSPPSNTVCSFYSADPPPTGPDSDSDGVPDKDDYCPADSGMTGTNPGILGCPDWDNDGVADQASDKDKDGYPDLTVDKCPGEKGDNLSFSDKGPHPSPGCPIKYKLAWMGMEVLNNSIAHHDSSGNWVYGESDDDFDIKDQYGNVIGRGEEPYLIFSFVNGQDPYGGLHAWTKRWCCGERVDVKSNGKEFEPDQDIEGETSTDTQYLKSLLNGSFNGITILGEGGDFTVIDNKTDLAMSVTLMERDWTNEKCFSSTYMSEWEIAAKAGAMVGKVAGGCMAGGFGCGVALVQGIVSYVKDMFALDSGPICIDVPDPDDYMGVNGWSISKEDAELKTNNNGAYAFWFDMPTSLTKNCEPIIPYQSCSIATMRTRVNFCIYREGIQESDINKVCSPYTQATWPAVQ